MPKKFHFTHLKPTFSILHTYFYKTLTSVCLLYTFIQIKYSKPSHHQPDQYPATINDQSPASINSINTHQLDQYSSKPSHHQPTDQYPSNKIDQTKNLKRIKVWCLSVRLDWFARLIGKVGLIMSVRLDWGIKDKKRRGEIEKLIGEAVRRGWTKGPKIKEREVRVRSWNERVRWRREKKI